MFRESHDIFISYSRKDLGVVERFRDQLDKGGYRVWMDQERIRTGDGLSSTLARAIKQSLCVVVVVSRNSMESSYVPKEIAYAQKKGIKVYLVYIDDPQQVELPEGLEFDLGDDRYERLDLSTLAIPAKLIDALAENHRLFSGAYRERKRNESTGDQNIDRRLDEYAKLLDRASHQRQFRDSLLGRRGCDRARATLCRAGAWSGEPVGGGLSRNAFRLTTCPSFTRRVSFAPDTGRPT